MRSKSILLFFVMILLTSCAAPTPQSILTAVPTSTRTPVPIPTATQTLKPPSDSEPSWIQNGDELFIFDSASNEWIRVTQGADTDLPVYEANGKSIIIIGDEWLAVTIEADADGKITALTDDGTRMVWGEDGWEAVKEVNMPDEVATLIDKSGGRYVWDSEKNVVFDPETGLLMGVQLPDGEWKTNFEGIYTVISREGEMIKLPIYVDGKALLDFLETSNIIRDDKDIIKQGGQWVQDKKITPMIFLSPQLERPDNQLLIVYVQVEGSGFVSVQHLLEPAFHFVEDLKTFFVFKLGEFRDLNSGLVVSLATVPVKGGEQLVFVLGSEQEVFENMRLTANE